MIFVALSLDGTRKSAVQLEQDIIYRIGRRLGLEFHTDDESIELAHATITLLENQIVRVSAVAGKVHLNGREIEIKSISRLDIVNDGVDLRFGDGDVNAKLYFNDGKLAIVDNEAAHDSSGYEEGYKDKSTITNGDSLIIPESRPPSADTTCDEDSFNIPETQAIYFTRRSKDYEISKILCGDDFLIPETQEVLPHIKNPVIVRINPDQDLNIASDDDASELCTQEFNEFNEDAIDDFDSSLLLGDANVSAIAGKIKRTRKLSEPPTPVEIKAKISCDYDILIPETQEVLPHSKKPVIVRINPDEDLNIASDDDASELGTQIRMCTQEFNEFNEDAIDDFDSSLLLEDANVSAIARKVKRTRKLSEPPTPVEIKAKISCGDDILIPETQEVLPHSKKPVIVRINPNQDLNNASDDDTSELGTQIRMCTQEFNQFNEDAIDDFDSSLLLGDANVSAKMFGRVNSKQTPEVLGDERDISAFNWSASNSKCTTLNSTKADEVCPRSEICLTPDLSASGSKSNDIDDVRSTPDLFDFLQVNANESSGSRAAELVNVNADVHSISSHQNTVDPAQQPLVGSMETPEATPANPDDQLKDNVAAQALPGRNPTESACNEQDFIATQAFERVNLQFSRNSNKDDHNEDFIETQAFPARKSFLTPHLKSKSNQDQDNVDLIETEVFPTRRSSKDAENQDFIETQAFPTRISFLAPQLKSKRNKIHDNSQDLIATQAFIRHPQTSKTIPSDAGSNSLSNAEDFIETQLFVSRDKNTSISLDLTACSRLQLSDSLSIGDEIDHELKQLIALSSLPSSQSDDEANDKLVNSTGISHKIHEDRLCQPEGIVNDLEKKEKCATRERERAGPRSEAPDAPPRKIKRTRKLSEPPTPVEIKAPTKATRIHRKRPIVPSEDKEETKSLAAPKIQEIKQRKVKETMDAKDDDNTEISADRQPVNRRRTRQDTLKMDADSKDSSSTEVPGSSNAQNARKLKGKSSASAKIVESGRAPIAKAKHDTKASEDTSETPIDGKQTPIAKRAMSAQRKKLPDQDPLQDINDYIKKIKSSGRKIQITLSMCNYAELRSLLNSLRNVVDVTENPLCSDLLLMDKGERTYKFLVTVASNKPVLSISWLHAIKETRSIVVKPNHIFKDKKFEELFKYNPLQAMEQPSILKDHHFMLGNTIQPNVKEMKAIVESAGGTVHGKPPPIESNVRLYVIASKQDKQIFKQVRNYSNLQYIKTEGIMQTIVRHNRELLDEYKLQV